MNNDVLKHIHDKLPKFNSDIAIGFACSQMKHVEAYIDQVMRCAASGFPDGVKYHRYERVSPIDEFNFKTFKKGVKRIYEYASSDVYLIRYVFSYMDEEFYVHQFLPWVRPGGVIRIVGSYFQISPVLADKAISVDEDSIFIPLNRDKLTFRRLTHNYVLDGTRVMANVIWSNIYHVSKKNRLLSSRRLVYANATIGHYLFCKYGLQGAFSVTSGADVFAGLPDVVNEENYPPSEWHICESTKWKPNTLRTKYYTGTNIRLAIRRKDYNVGTQGLISSFFYVVDHFPIRMEALAQIEYLNDTRLWRVLMGHLYFTPDEPEGKLLNRIDVHMESLDGYVDGMVKEWLQEDNVFVNSVYELFMHVIETYSIRITESGQSVSSMYGKRLMVLRYVLIDIIKGIFGMMFALQVLSKKKISRQEVIKTVEGYLKAYSIMRINYQHTEVSSASNETSCMAIKLTANIVPQTNISNGQGGKTTVINASRLLHSSLAEVGQCFNLPKADPTGKTRINPYVLTTPTGVIVRKPHLIEKLDEVESLISR
jgi:hypothetical protein